LLFLEYNYREYNYRIIALRTTNQNRVLVSD